jgi:ubiquinone/menaquinone biosynthesis C-methylase UbiE
MKILDLGCGLGIQCFKLIEKFPRSKIIGLDISQELLKKARFQALERGMDITFIAHSMDDPLPFESEEFDLVTCNYSLHYVRNLHFSISEIHRVLEKDGCVFATGPDLNNKPEFFELIKRLTGRPIPFMPAPKRFASDALPVFKKLFAKVEYYTLKNPLVFYKMKPFIKYLLASLIEDRLFWLDVLPDAEAIQVLCNMAEKEISHTIEVEGSFTITKAVGGILGYK